MRRIFVLGCAAFAALVTPAAASAATIVVDTTGPSTPASCSLANAIEAANTDAAVNGCGSGGGLSDTIEFALPSPSTITLSTELPEIHDYAEIAGPGAGALTISGDDSVRVMHIGRFAHVKLTDLTIADGRATIGGGIYNETGFLDLSRVVLRDNEAIAAGGANAEAKGGAIYNTGDITLNRVVAVGNTANASGASAASIALGGAIASEWEPLGGLLPEVVLNQTAVRNNRAEASGAPATTATGGGIFNRSGLALSQSTVSGNEAVVSGGASSNDASGGGIGNGADDLVRVSIGRSTIAENGVSAASPAGIVAGGGLALTAGEASIRASTIAYNSAPSGANLVLRGSAPIRDTIVAKPLGGQSCTGLASLSGGWNLDEDGSCHLGAPSDRSNLGALLAPGLADDGGPTETIALLHGSPAIDGGTSGSSEAADQRDRKRPVEIPSVANNSGGNGADIGAYEVQIPRATITAGPDGPTPVAQQPSFQFAAGEAGATFLCSIDGGPAAACTSPYKVPLLAAGSHTFAVAAVGTAGYAQEPPVARSFTIAGGSPPPVAKAPQTRLSHFPSRTTKRRLTIRFSSNQADSRFSCKLDGRKWRACHSPYTTPKLKLGKHTFRVKATGPTGVVDPTATKRSFRIVAPRHR